MPESPKGVPIFIDIQIIECDKSYLLTALVVVFVRAIEGFLLKEIKLADRLLRRGWQRAYCPGGRGIHRVRGVYALSP